jgi:hypothetical protein
MWYFHHYDCSGGSTHRLLSSATTSHSTTVVNPKVPTATSNTTVSNTTSSYENVANHSTPQFLDTKFDEYSFLFAHCYCVFAHIVTTLCYKCNQHEIGKFFDISKVPVYFYFIFRAHYYELNMITHTDGFDLSCGDGKFNLYELWLLLELRIFYGYILTGIFFLLMSSFFGINKKLKQNEEMLTKRGGDFLESYRSA